MNDTTYRIGWWDSKPGPLENAGWRMMPIECNSLLAGQDLLIEIRRMYPGNRFALIKVMTEIIAQLN